MKEPVKSGRGNSAARQGGGSDRGSRSSHFSPMIGFLNSPFGLWFLSTIFISLGSWSFTEWRDSRADWKSRMERVSRLDLEITHRLDQGDLAMQPLQTADAGAGRADVLAALPARVLLAPERSNQLFPEYANWSLRALLAELHGLLDEDGVEAHCVRRALIAQRQFQLRWLTAPPRPDQTDMFQEELARIADWRWSLIARLALTRTRDEGGLDRSGSGLRPYCEAQPAGRS